MFIPTTKNELSKLGWNELDVILITGDVYLDSPYFGVSIIGQVLLDAGYKVGIIAQPDINSDADISRLGEPKLFWGVTSGCVDSMVSNYTSSIKKRNKDDLTPGGENNRRPNRAVIAYTNLIRKYFKNTVPIVLGGIEASLRRIAHYDAWEDKIRRSILFDSKADYLLYGMAEKSILETAEALKNNKKPLSVRGLCYISKENPVSFIELPSYEESALNKDIFEKMFLIFYENSDPFSAKGLIQKHGDRFLIHNPPVLPLSQQELDKVYSLSYERDVHPYYKAQGEIKALETIKFSITTHRGCFGECAFCAISMHQGHSVISRSVESILLEAESFTADKNFNGIIYDLGGPTANMYGMGCDKNSRTGKCFTKSCLLDNCENLNISHEKELEILKKVSEIKGVRKIFITSGVRYDLILNDKKFGEKYLEELIKHHVSGQLKIAPEHSETSVLELMRKPPIDGLKDFIKIFNDINKKCGSSKFLTYYFIAAHPGSDVKEMMNLKKFIKSELQITTEQVQIFTPTPSTLSTLLYWTEKNYKTGEKIFVEKKLGGKIRQKSIIIK